MDAVEEYGTALNTYLETINAGKGSLKPTEEA